MLEEMVEVNWEREMTDREEELVQLRLNWETKKKVIDSVDIEWNPYMNIEEFIH